MITNVAVATDQLSAAAREKMPTQIELAGKVLRNADDRDQALALLTVHFRDQPHSGVCVIAADALLRLAEADR